MILLICTLIFYTLKHDILLKLPSPDKTCKAGNRRVWRVPRADGVTGCNIRATRALNAKAAGAIKYRRKSLLFCKETRHLFKTIILC